MPSLDLLLLPLLGGFLFVSQWYPTKYSALRSAGYKLLFMAAIAGVTFLFLATLFITGIYNTPLGEWSAQQWHKFVPFTHSGKAALSFLIGAALWWPLNWLGEHPNWPHLNWLKELLSWLRARLARLDRWMAWLSDDAAVNRAIARKSDPLELMLRQALGDGRIIAVTLKTGKVYIGNLTTNLNPAFAVESIHLLLRRSGHRDPDTQQLTIDVDYDETHAASRKAVTEEFRKRLDEVVRELRWIPDEVRARLSEEAMKTYKKQLEDELTQLPYEELAQLAKARMKTVSDIQNYEIVILTSEVVSVNYFDLQLYDEQFKPKEEPGTSSQSDEEPPEN